MKIGFLWHNVSSGNLGVGALSISNMILVNKACKEIGISAEFITIGDEEITDENNKSLVESQIGISFNHKVINVKKLILNPVLLFNYIKYINSLDVVLDIGAGDSFSDIYGKKRFTIQVFTKFVNAIFAKKSILSPQTIGPFKSSFAEKVASVILNKTDVVFARDSISLDVGSKYASCYLGTDVALSMPFKNNIIGDTSSIKVGINVSGLLWNGGYTNNNQFGLAHNYKEYVYKLIESFLEIENVDVHLISHVIATSPIQQVEDDYSACLELKERFPDCKVAPRFTNPITAKNYISSMDYFTGARMHATIAAYSSGVPVTPYAYSRKFKGLYSTLGYNKVLEAKEIDLIDAVQLNIEHFFNRDTLRQEIAMCSERKNLLTAKYVEELKLLLAK
ncbi:polysaccharide pyruvyl transferase family protein [Vibrio cholerae]|uniref:polysaccharide pyruvyl transferase family protein n=1 Tax=Vibrio cholerae TaxID=666 RepID=UPI0006E6F1A2|nr:polysaccharide pyruvyl transferase family protein [Vibrio cholerae]KQA33981.1 polysaccharide pyruvyl transferase [Vibrio cholerae]PAR97742.1 polysaccharide pyruvyl transferase family protein [Vibrio cholerae]PAS20219.1 polysaccharide pyruvyl transferase family protein [Vibrio cholerae]TQP80514.1 polysaccharide pyruvyl transferase family protein [Vibrio cholerae]HAS3154913.1 polysaccharide pyruvyl transferase family protein [Vibrio cholerae]